MRGRSSASLGGQDEVCRYRDRAGRLGRRVEIEGGYVQLRPVERRGSGHGQVGRIGMGGASGIGDESLVLPAAGELGVDPDNG